MLWLEDDYAPHIEGLLRAVTVKAGVLAPPGGLGLDGREHGGMLDAAGTAEDFSMAARRALLLFGMDTDQSMIPVSINLRHVIQNVQG
ncbi:MAG: hypothetical protein ACLPSO_16845 [Terracidiphilus sp.]